MKIGKQKVDIVVLFNQYDAEKYGGAIQRFKHLFTGLRSCEITYLVIDNKNCASAPRRFDSDTIFIGGENSCREFSGWKKGIDHICEQNIPYDLVLFTNDAFALNLEEYRTAISDDLFRMVKSYNLSCGIVWSMNRYRGIDAFLNFEPIKYAIDSEMFNYWIRSNFLIAPFETVKKMPWQLLSADGFFPTEFGPRIYLDNERLSPNLRQRLLEYLCTGYSNDRSVWHSRFVLDQGSYPLFKVKAIAILNEMWLSIKLREAGLAVLDIRTIPLLSLVGSVSRRTPESLIAFLQRRPLAHLVLLYHFKRAWKRMLIAQHAERAISWRRMAE